MILRDFLNNYVSDDTMIRLVIPLEKVKGFLKQKIVSLNPNVELAYTDVSKAVDILDNKAVYKSLFMYCEIYTSYMDYNVTPIKFERDAITIAIKIPKVEVGDVVTVIDTNNNLGTIGYIKEIDRKDICEVVTNDITGRVILVDKKMLLKIAVSDKQKRINKEIEDYDRDYIPVV